MKNLVSCIISLIIILSCNNQVKDVPEDIISEDKMVEVITEIELTQALIKLKFLHQDTLNPQQLFNEVYSDFNVSKEQFNKSLAFYSQEPKTIENIYVKVIINLSKRQAEIQ